MILLFCWGTLPYLLLAGLTWVIRSAPVLVTAAVVLAITDFMAMNGANTSGRSTSGLDLVFQPAVALLVIVPAATVAGLVLRAFPAWRRWRAKRTDEAR